MNIKSGSRMTDPVTVYFDGEKYLVLSKCEDCWGEGITLDDAYSSYKSKKLERGLLSSGQSIFDDIGLMYMVCRGKIIHLLALVTLLFAIIIAIDGKPPI